MKWIFIGVLFFSCKAYAQDEKIKCFELKGYVKDLQNISFIDNTESILTSNLIHNRLNLKWNISESLYTRIEARNRIFYGEQIKLIPHFGKTLDAGDEYLHLNKLWVDENSLVIHSTIDRILLNYSISKFNVTLGRQRINWGINTIWNPNDIFNAYNFLDFDYEERPGTDALRVQYFLNSKSSFEIAAKPSEKAHESIKAVLFRTNKWKYDLQFIVADYKADFMAGGGWAGNIKDAGFKGEISYFRNKDEFSKDAGSISVSATLDYTLKNSWYITAAALYQSKSTKSILLNTQLYNISDLSPKNLMPYQETFYAGVQKQFAPIFASTLAVIYSPDYSSTIILPSFTWSVASNFDIDLTMQIFMAEREGVYRTMGNSVYLRMKFSF